MLANRFAGFSWAAKLVAAKSARIKTPIPRINRQFIAE
jgi:hypothetical protein